MWLYREFAAYLSQLAENMRSKIGPESDKNADNTPVEISRT
jgi:hypothetical protein